MHCGGAYDPTRLSGTTGCSACSLRRKAIAEAALGPFSVLTVPSPDLLALLAEERVPHLLYREPEGHTAFGAVQKPQADTMVFAPGLLVAVLRLYSARNAATLRRVLRVAVATDERARLEVVFEEGGDAALCALLDVLSEGP